MPGPSRPRKELVLVGGGHAHVQVLRHLAMEPPPGTRVTVVVDTPMAVYSGMVPGFVADNTAQLGSRRGILELAMMAEAHALDLYLLFAQVVTDEASRDLLHAVADEERVHLARLGRLMEGTA